MTIKEIEKLPKNFIRAEMKRKDIQVKDMVKLLKPYGENLNVQKNFPLNVMYWVVNSDGTYEVLDGQQRTISICEYVAGKFSINDEYLHTLEDKQEQI